MSEAKTVASCHKTDRFIMAEALRKFFDLHPSDLRVCIPIEKHIARDLYAQLERYHYKKKPVPPATVSHIAQNNSKTFCLDYLSWISLAEVNGTIEVADNSVLDTEELPDYEKYLEMTKTLKVKDIIDSEAFYEGLVNAIISAAENKSLTWLRQQKIDTKAFLEEYGYDASEDRVMALIMKEHRYVVYLAME